MASQTIIGIFRTTEQAARAKQALLSNGFEAQDIQINSHVDTEEELVTDGQMTDTTETSLPEESGNLNKQDREGSVITIEVYDSDRIQLATDVLKECGATDVNEFSKPV